MWALRIKDVPFEHVRVDPYHGDHRKPDYAGKFPIRTIPALEDSGMWCFSFHSQPEKQLCIAESNAMLMYLADKYNWDDWYPKDIVERAKVNQYLCYHISGTRKCSTLFFGPHLFAALAAQPVRSPHC
jgi:glutathione S-transferase